MAKVSVEEYHRLVEAGVLGPVELLEGRVMMGGHALVFSPAQVRAAKRLGVTVASCVDAVLADPASRADVTAGLAAGEAMQ